MEAQINSLRAPRWMKSEFSGCTHNGGYLRGLPGQPTERAARVGGNTQAHRRRGVRDVAAGLEQGPISRSWSPDAMTSRWRPWPEPGLRVFRLVQARMRRDRDARAYLWVGRPATVGRGVHHVQAVSSRVTPSPLSRRRAARNPAPTTPFTTVRDAQKTLSLIGKGLDLRKLVAGAGFEPATSGL